MEEQNVLYCPRIGSLSYSGRSHSFQDTFLNTFLLCWLVRCFSMLQILTVFGVFQFNLEAPPVTCLLLCLFYCYYISKLLRLSSCSALSWPLWLVHCCIVFPHRSFPEHFFSVPSELWICIFSLYHLKTRATIKKSKWTSWSLRALSSAGSLLCFGTSSHCSVAVGVLHLFTFGFVCLFGQRWKD